MIAEVLKEDVYSLAEMAEILFARHSRLPTPEKRQAKLLRNIRSATNHPPFCEFAGQFFFPKVSFRDWAMKRPLATEVRRVG